METEKYILSFELRYNKVNAYKSDSLYVCDKTMIGIYNSEREAIDAGNKFLREVVAKHFLVEDSDLFTEKHRLASNVCQKTISIVYFAEIQRFRFTDATEMCLDAFDAVEELKEWWRERDKMED